MRVEFDDLMTLSDCDPGDLEDIQQTAGLTPASRHVDNWQSILGITPAPAAPPVSPVQPRLPANQPISAPATKSVKGPFGLPAKIMGYPSTYVVVGVGGVLIVGLALLLKKKKKPVQAEQSTHPSMGQYPYPQQYYPQQPQYYRPTTPQYYQPAPSPQYYQPASTMPVAAAAPVPAPVVSTSSVVQKNRSRRTRVHRAR